MMESQWTDILSVRLLGAYVTRYKQGTDELRSVYILRILSIQHSFIECCVHCCGLQMFPITKAPRFCCSLYLFVSFGDFTLEIVDPCSSLFPSSFFAVESALYLAIFAVSSKSSLILRQTLLDFTNKYPCLGLTYQSGILFSTA